MEYKFKMKYLNPEEPLHEGIQNRKYISKEECKYIYPDQPERSKREDKYFIIKGSNESIVLDAICSEECKEYHKNSCIQINHDNNSYLMRCSEQSGN